MSFPDLREWLEKVKSFNELREVEGVDWYVELGAITEIAHKEIRRKGRFPSAFLFDSIKDYPQGFRVLTGVLSSPKRLATSLGINEEVKEKIELVKVIREKLQGVKLIPPLYVEDGPILENVDEGKNINLFKFPAPFWHEKDGGRYIGTGSVTITRDPEDGWINMGTYRVMIHDQNTLSFYISPGKHGRIHREKYYQKEKPCPVVISFGHHPLIYLLGGKEADYGQSEYNLAGGIMGKPVEVIKGLWELPIPARSELVIEGESIPGEVREEGPFGEWTGYYASLVRPEPIIRVKRVLYRNSPIILGAPPSKPPNENSFASCTLRAALIWNDLEKSGVPDIRGVYCHEAGGHRLLVVVAIKQRYPGHSKQVGILASQCHSAAYLGRYVIVVDDDINPANLEDVIWAVCTRSDPEKDIDIIRRCWSGALDPIIPLAERGFNSRAIIDATKPYERLSEFPEVVAVSEGRMKDVRNKWSWVWE